MSTNRPIFKNVLVLGDSIADGFYDSEGIGWVGRLEKRLHEDNPMGWGFQNFSLSGDRTVDALYHLGDYLARGRSDYLFLCIGVNDIFRYGRPDAPVSIALDLRHRYWDRIFKLAKPFFPEIVVFGLLPVNEKLNPDGEDDFGTPLYCFNKDIEEYNAALKEWCAAEDVVFIDFYDRFLLAGHERLLLDSSHPNTNGHKLISQWAYEYLKDKIL